ncbi:hypothetical protein CDAR_472231 [Caerostris darwini]|uniref:Uncharacterized protein n=1 Tax=Caerostris darwini TaxID=1538125 RepID=A0AAV4VLP9_9ARAC|nr:hypothetical protein CDAR_472231 [Caerostris darwini]
MRQSCHKFCHGRLAVDKTALHRATAAATLHTNSPRFYFGFAAHTWGLRAHSKRGRALLRYQQQRATVVSLAPTHNTPPSSISGRVSSIDKTKSDHFGCVT